MKNFVLSFALLFTFLLKGYSQFTKNETDVRRVGISKPRIGKITEKTFDVIFDGKVVETVEYTYYYYGSIQSVSIGIDTWEFKYAFKNSSENYLAYNCIRLSEFDLNCLNEGKNFRNYVLRDFLLKYYH